MDAEMKAKWVKALRSGEYKQGQNVLRRGDSFCCLGVLCDLHDPLRWEADVDSEEAARYLDHAVGFLPIVLMHKLGLSPKEEHDVAGMNDEGKSFSEIADYIERCL